MRNAKARFGHRSVGCFKAWTVILALIVSASACMKAVAGSETAPDATTIVQELGHGINLACALEAPREGMWGLTLRDDYFAVIEKAGFTTVRVPICWSAHAAQISPYRIDPAFLQRIDWVVAEAKAHHLYAILDFQNYNELIADPEKHEDRYVGIWQQIAEHYRGAPSTILFELFNEPHGNLDAVKWNSLLARTIAVIRPTNPTRLIVVGPVSWNKISSLRLLVLPADDPYLVATVHYYDPMTFTHQGAPWEKTSLTWLGTKWLGTDAEKQSIDSDFDSAVAWASEHNRPMLVGEFGTYEKCGIESRQRWTSYIARSAEAHGMAWAYWEFGGNFGAYDPKLNTWRGPIIAALRPK